MPDTARWTEHIPLDDLVPADRNAKAHDQAALARSVDAFGFIEPVVIDERTGKLLAGHGRDEYLRARRDAGEPPPEGVEVDDSGRWLVFVVRGVTSRDDDHAEALGLALNRIGQLGGWADDILAEALDSIDAQLVEAAGWSSADVDLLAAGLASLDVGPTDPEEAWAGMPEYSSTDRTSRWATTVNFPTPEDAERFAREHLGLDKHTRSVWWPKRDGFVGSDVTQVHVIDEPAP